eukprot:2381193-Pyramimonas_sp.AAC.1
MKHDASLSDGALEVMGTMYAIMEASGRFPGQVSAVVLSLRQKPSGGVRPIGLFCSSYRLWGRRRRKYATQWERGFQRSYFSWLQFTSAVDVAWGQNLRAEGAVAKRQSGCTPLWDLFKCFEFVQLATLLQRCHQYKFPVQLARLAARGYRHG